MRLTLTLLHSWEPGRPQVLGYSHPMYDGEKYYVVELLGGCVAALNAVRDDDGRFALEFVVQVVDGVLQPGGDAPVVLRRDEDEGVQALYAGGPCTRVFVRVARGAFSDLRGDVRLIEEREVQSCDIDVVEGEG